MRILVAEELPAIAKSWCAMLAAQHYAIDLATDGQSAWRFIDTYEYDLLIIDEVLPQLDGVSLCRQVRNSGKQMPILLIAQHNDSHQRSIGLDAGADDYMIQPLHGEELVARVRALRRRQLTTNSPILSWGQLQLIAHSQTVTFEQKILGLTPKEYALLELLLHDSCTSEASKMHRVFSYDVIIEHLWVGDDHPSEETVRTHMKGLRHKLKAAGMVTDPIETVYGVGYRLRPSPISTPISASNSQHLSLLIADPDPEIAAELAVIAQQAGWRVQTFTNTDNLLSILANIEIDSLTRLPILVLEPSIAQNLTTASQILAAVNSTLTPLPIIIWSNCTDLDTRQMVANHQAHWFIAKSNSAQFVFQTAQKVLRQQHSIADEKKILVLHNDSSTLMSLHQALEPLNYQITSIKQPQLLWSSLTTNHPDLVIIDFVESDVSGLEVCKMIRQDANWHRLPIAILTKKFDLDTIHQFFVAGANDVWSKPILLPEILTNSVQKMLQAYC